MKKNELQGLRTKGQEEAKKLLSDKKVELAKVKANLKSSSEKNLKKAKNLSRDIAQISTIVREKELTEQESGRVEEHEKKGQSLR